MKRKIHSDVFLAVILFAIGLTMFIMAFKFPEASRRFPFLATCLVMLFSVIILVQGIKKTKELSEDYVSPYNWKTIKFPVLMFLTLAGYFVLIKLVGFLIATAIYVIGTMLFCGVKSIPKILIFAAAIDLFIWFLFVVEFKMVLP